MFFLFAQHLNFLLPMSRSPGLRLTQTPCACFFFKGLQERHWFFPQMNVSFKLWILHEMIPSWGKTLWPEVVNFNSGDLTGLMKGITWYPSQVFHGRNPSPRHRCRWKVTTAWFDKENVIFSIYISIAAGFLPSASLISSKCLDLPSLKIRCTYWKQHKTQHYAMRCPISFDPVKNSLS